MIVYEQTSSFPGGTEISRLRHHAAGSHRSHADSLGHPSDHRAAGLPHLLFSAGGRRTLYQKPPKLSASAGNRGDSLRAPLRPGPLRQLELAASKRDDNPAAGYHGTAGHEADDSAPAENTGFTSVCLPCGLYEHGLRRSGCADDRAVRPDPGTEIWMARPTAGNVSDLQMDHSWGSRMVHWSVCFHRNFRNFGPHSHLAVFREKIHLLQGGSVGILSVLSRTSLDSVPDLNTTGRKSPPGNPGGNSFTH